MKTDNRFFVFMLDEQRYAVRLFSVEKVIRAIEISAITEDKGFLLGLINIQGKIIPVMDIRRRLRLPKRELDIDDRIILGHVSSRTIAFPTDKVLGVFEFKDGQILEAEQAFPEVVGFIYGVAKIVSDTVIICDIERMFSIYDPRDS